jgi:hypothetical protein
MNYKYKVGDIVQTPTLDSVKYKIIAIREGYDYPYTMKELSRRGVNNWRQSYVESLKKIQQHHHHATSIFK